jgi:hypothetical protein
MAKKSEENIPFSPILIMEFVRQVTINRFMNGETAVKFKLPKSYYEEIKAFPLKAQTIHLDIAYDEKTEVLTVKADDTIVNRFKEQKSMTEIAGKYEGQYAERYKQFIEVLP